MQYLLVLVRHAETEANTRGIIQGHQDSKLTQNGVHGAEILAEWLSSVNFTHVVTSDLQRAIRTSEIVLSRNKHINLESSDQNVSITRSEHLRERNFGPNWSGRQFRELYNEAKKENCVYPNYCTDGMEPLLKMRQRAFHAFSTFSFQIGSENGNEIPVKLSSEARTRLGLGPASYDPDQCTAVVLVVTHGGIIRELLTSMADRRLVVGGLPNTVPRLAGNCCFYTMVVNVTVSNRLESCVHDIHLIAANQRPREIYPVVKLK